MLWNSGVLTLQIGKNKRLMTKYEGPIKNIDSTPEKVYSYISNFDNFENIIPKEHIKEWESDGDSCRFKVDKIGNVGLKIVDKE